LFKLTYTYFSLRTDDSPQIKHRHGIKITAVILRNREEIIGRQPVFGGFVTILQVDNAILYVARCITACRADKGF
jgi:hypothetical protein